MRPAIDYVAARRPRLTRRQFWETVVRAFGYIASALICSALFVKAHDSARLQSIPEGHYSLRYSTGLDWQDSEQSFQWDPTYNEFERELDYLEIKRGDETEYHEISVTLHAVPGGTVRTYKISREEFLGMSGS